MDTTEEPVTQEPEAPPLKELEEPAEAPPEEAAHPADRERLERASRRT